ncbi:MAG: hypothetical protein Q9208_006828 [Pyrenodesmia sp. 3 TL-2023]
MQLARSGSERPPGRGRPPTRAVTVEGLGRGRGQSTIEEDLAETPSNVVPSTIFEPPSLGSAPRSRTASPVKSPSKGSGKSFADAKTDSTIDMRYLETCTPSVHLRALNAAHKSGDVPQAVTDLYMSLTDTSGGCIPLALKVSLRSSLVVSSPILTPVPPSHYEEESKTPRKSRQPPYARQYLGERRPTDGESSKRKGNEAEADKSSRGKGNVKETEADKTWKEFARWEPRRLRAEPESVHVVHTSNTTAVGPGAKENQPTAGSSGAIGDLVGGRVREEEAPWMGYIDSDAGARDQRT